MREELLTKVMGQLHMPKFIKLNYLEKNIEVTIEYLQEILHKLQESNQFNLLKSTDIKKVALDILTQVLIHKGLHNVLHANDNMIDLLRIVEKKRYVVIDDVAEVLHIRTNFVKKTLKPLLKWKILQAVVIPTLEVNYWARGYGWFGDTIVHDYLINQVYNLIYSYNAELKIQPSYAFSYEFGGKEYTKVSDGKISTIAGIIS